MILVTSNRAKCVVYVYVRDQYRRTGRGPSGFELHYNRRRCSRFADAGGDRCWQHVGKYAGETTEPR